MSVNTYKPSFLIAAEVPGEQHAQLEQYAKQHGVSEEQVYRQAIKFFSSRCVHTHKRSSRRRAIKSAR